jgi:hypothetical protein
LEQEHQHAPWMVFCFSIILALRYLQCCHCLETFPPPPGGVCCCTGGGVGGCNLCVCFL